jgi:hypothetical protein
MIDQRTRRRTCSDVAADDFDLREILLDPLHAAQHALRMTVCSIDHQHVHTRLHQQFDTLFRSFAHTNGSACAQTT